MAGWGKFQKKSKNPKWPDPLNGDILAGNLLSYLFHNLILGPLIFVIQDQLQHVNKFSMGELLGLMEVGACTASKPGAMPHLDTSH